MIFNARLDRLMEINIVRNFMRTHSMESKMCHDGENHSFIIYRLPYAIVFWDALIENYLEIVLLDMCADLLLTDGSIVRCSVDLGWQTREGLRRMDFTNHRQKDVFLSGGGQKMYGLYTTLEAIDKLLPLIDAKGGLTAMQDGSLDHRFDFSDFVQPIYPGLKHRFLSCIGVKEYYGAGHDS